MTKKDLVALKDPVLRNKVEAILDNPSGNAISELTEQDMQNMAGAGIWDDFSASLGNKGGYCTLTKECQAMCN